MVDTPLALALRAFADALAAANRETLPALEGSGVLFVAGAARLRARASIRGFGADARSPEVEVHGARVRYEVCLRPRFFLDTDAEARPGIVAHELFHAHPAFDGRLAEARRHRALGDAEIERRVTALLTRVDPSPLIAAFEGDLALPAWRVRPPTRIPPGSALPRRYDDSDLYVAPVGAWRPRSPAPSEA